MPNWAFNKITCKNKQDYKALLDLMLDKDGNIDFNRVIPMPSSLDIDATGIVQQMANVSQYLFGNLQPHSIDEVEAAIRAQYPFVRFDDANIPPDTTDPFDLATAFHMQQQQPDVIGPICLRLISKPRDNNSSDAKQGKAALHNLITYGTTDWYTWSCQNWGTKWNGTQTETDDTLLTLRWNTAWGPSAPVVIEAVKHLGITALYEYSEEQETAFSGELLFENGTLTEIQEYDGTDDQSEIDTYRIYARMFDIPDGTNGMASFGTTDTKILRDFKKIH